MLFLTRPQIKLDLLTHDLEVLSFLGDFFEGEQLHHQDHSQGKLDHEEDDDEHPEGAGAGSVRVYFFEHHQQDVDEIEDHADCQSSDEIDHKETVVVAQKQPVNDAGVAKQCQKVGFEGQNQ